MGNEAIYREYPNNQVQYWVNDEHPLKGHYDYLLRVISGALNRGFYGETNEFFHGIDAYIEMCGTEFSTDYATIGAKMIDVFLTDNGVGVRKRERILDNLNGQYFALYQALGDIMVVGVDTSKTEAKDWMKTSLYTRSIDILYALEANGQLINDLSTVLDKLTNKTLTSLEKGLQAVVRLDPVNSEGSKPIFEAKIPQSSLNAGGGTDIALIPVASYILFATYLKKVSKNTPLHIETETIQGKRSYNIGVTPNIYAQAYKNIGVDKIRESISKMVVGFDVSTMRYFAYDLEASIHGRGTISVRPEMLNELKPIAIDRVDTRRHEIDFQLLRQVFITKVNQLTAKTVPLFKFVEDQKYRTLYDFREIVTNQGLALSNKDLFNVMLMNEGLFGKLPEELEKRKRLQLRILKGLEPVELPEDALERKKLVESLMQQGLVKITSKRIKTNGVFEIYASSHSTVLQQLLGKDYVARLETIRVKLYHVRYLLKQTEVIDRWEFEDMIVKYNVQDIFEALFLEIALPPKIPTANIVPYVEEGIEFLQEKAWGRSRSESNVLYRIVTAETNKNFYGNVDAENILAISFKKFK